MARPGLKRAWGRLVGRPGSDDPVDARLPAWAAAADLLAVALGALVVRILAIGGLRFGISELRVTATSWWRPALWAVAVLAVRHLLCRRDPLHRRALGVLRRFAQNPALRAALAPGLTSRLVVLLVGYLAVSTIGFGEAPPWRISDNELLNLPARWDAGWYLDIAQTGYSRTLDPTRTADLAFFPLLPLLMRVAAAASGLPVAAAGYLVVVGAFFWGLTYLYRLARLDVSDDAARAALMFAAFYPFAVFYSALFTESVFLLVAAGGMYHMRQGEAWKAGAFGLLAGLTRPNGCLLALPLTLIVLHRAAQAGGWIAGGATSDTRMSGRRIATLLIAAGMPVAGVVAFSGYIYTLTGDPLAWVRAQQAWGRGFGTLVGIVVERFSVISTQGFYEFSRGHAVEIMEATAALFALGSVWPVTRRFGLAYGLLIAICLLPPLYSAGTESVGRYSSPLFPIFIWLGAAVRRSDRPYWIAAFASGQALVAALFFTWRPPF